MRRVIARTPPPLGELVAVEPVKMGAQPDRVDHWDAYVCRFADAAEAPD